MSNKLNITPGPWISETNSFEVMKHAGMRICLCDSIEREVNNSMRANNATAIVTAVNNTYHKGINPEVVPALFGFMKFIHDQNILTHEAQKGISEIIKKATL